MCTMLNDASAKNASRCFCFCDVEIDYISQKLCFTFWAVLNTVSISRDTPYKAMFLFFFSIPPHPTKTVQRCFGGKEPDVYFEVVKLKKPNPQTTQYVSLTLMRYIRGYFASLVLCFGVEVFFNYLFLIRSIFFS